jgi:hypothetical protein
MFGQRLFQSDRSAKHHTRYQTSEGRCAYATQRSTKLSTPNARSAAPIPAVPGIEAAATSFGNPGALAYVLAKRQAWFTYSALNGANVLLMDN